MRYKTELYLNSCDDTDENNSEIRGTGNKIGDNGLFYLCKELKIMNNLKILNLKSIYFILYNLDNNITSIGISSLFESLKYIPELRNLNISRI